MKRSYVWGTESNPRTIKLSSRKFFVTRNLFDALWQLRHPKDERPPWVDALCINHCDETDKMCQIQLMGEIYQRAMTVKAWLG
ncbi:heterokaryon incompatibility, partial [Pyrenochaeta sp. MPI-SDFR-AT-0127]